MLYLDAIDKAAQSRAEDNANLWNKSVGLLPN
jgi:hypothetical protein